MEKNLKVMQDGDAVLIMGEYVDVMKPQDESYAVTEQ